MQMDDAAIVAAVTGNFIAFRRLFRHLPSARLVEDRHWCWLDSGTGHPSWNGVISYHFSPDEAKPRIEKIRDYFQKKNRPTSWWILAGSRPAEMQEPLVSAGFVQKETTPGMAVRLNQPVPIRPQPEGLEIRRVKSADEMQTYLPIVGNGFGAPAELLDTLFAVLRHPAEEMVHLLGYLDGEAVGTATLYPAAGAAGIHFVATLPGTRGRGVGTAITLRCMELARSMGYDIAVLRASKLGEPIYRRLGFRVFGELQQYVWSPETEKKEK